MRSFPQLDPAARRVLTFNFRDDIAPGDAIVSASVAAAVAAGEDDTPAQMMVGVPVIAGARVLQLVDGRPAGTAYTLKCIASTAAGEILTLSAVLTMRDGA